MGEQNWLASDSRANSEDVTKMHSHDLDGLGRNHVRLLRCVPFFFVVYVRCA